LPEVSTAILSPGGKSEVLQTPTSLLMRPFELVHLEIWIAFIYRLS
jgi:hypothetical protein